MNKTKIDWCDMTWNPVTGCLHGCDYCYARKIAQRFGMPQLDDNCHIYTGKIKNYDDAVHTGPYPWGFAPTLHTYRLTEPQKIKKPQTIFVCSMSDLFGDWVPDEWIQAVFDACARAPQHRYLFLTKNPKRYNDIRTNKARSISIARELRGHIFLGATATNQEEYYSAASALEDADQMVFTFLSIEPISSPIKAHEVDCFANWVIVGAETGNRKDKVVPEKKWVHDLYIQCVMAGTPVFMKESLRGIMGHHFVQEFPEGW